MTGRTSVADELPALVIVGASAGGLGVLRRLLSELPTDLPAAVLAVVHLPSRPARPLVDLVRDSCSMAVSEVVGPRRLQPGEVLVAPPDRHLEVVGEEVRPSERPHHNGVRPSVDVLFDSAARSLGRRVVAVVLSGGLSDGAVGAALVERAGGRVLVQDPGEAAVPGMPVSAIEATHVHDVVPTAALGAEVARLVGDVLAVSA